MITCFVCGTNNDLVQRIGEEPRGICRKHARQQYKAKYYKSGKRITTRLAYMETDAYKESRRSTKRRYAQSDRAKNLERQYRTKDKAKELLKIRSKGKYARTKARSPEKLILWRTNSLAGKLANNAKRRAAKLQRTPSWANIKAIRQFYIDCPEGMTVDHIVPLQGKTICGLHVENNLQYLTKSENSSKGNKLVLN